MHEFELHRRFVAMWLLLWTVASVACSGDGRDQRRDPDPVTLTLLTHDSFDASERVLAAFTEATGIQINVVPAGDAGQLVNRAILSAGNPEGDVLFGIDGNLLEGALEANVFQVHRSSRLGVVDDAFELDPEGRVTPIDHGEVCLNVDLGWFDRHDVSAPDSLADLTDPTYRGLTVVENPATSTPGLAFLLATVATFGDLGWEAY
jgi:thiamine transport system substrate-binding protein